MWIRVRVSRITIRELQPATLDLLPRQKGLIAAISSAIAILYDHRSRTEPLPDLPDGQDTATGGAAAVAGVDAVAEPAGYHPSYDGPGRMDDGTFMIAATNRPRQLRLWR